MTYFVDIFPAVERLLNQTMDGIRCQTNRYRGRYK